MQEESEGSMGSDRETFVLKRILVEKGDTVRLTGLRESYFGRLLQRRSNVARFLEAFELRGGRGLGELWLAFIDEGRSLASLLYTQVDEGKFTRKDSTSASTGR